MCSPQLLLSFVARRLCVALRYVVWLWCFDALQRPEFVSTFLQELLIHLHPIALEEIKGIEAEKKADQERRELGKLAGSVASASSSPPPAAVCEWDAAYYMGRIKATTFDLDDRTLSQYFPLHQCIQVHTHSHTPTDPLLQSKTLS